MRPLGSPRRSSPALRLLGLASVAWAVAACGGGDRRDAHAPGAAASSVPESGETPPPAATAGAASAGGAPAASDAGTSTAPLASENLEGQVGASTDPGLKAAEDDRELRCNKVGVELEKKVRPDLKACYREGKAKDGDLRGKVRITINVNTVGKVTNVVAGDKTLPEPVVKCMVAAVKKVPPSEPGACSGKSIVLPIEFPTPH